MALKKTESNPMGVTVDPVAVAQTAEEITSSIPETSAVEPEAPTETLVDTASETQPNSAPETVPDELPTSSTVSIPETKIPTPPVVNIPETSTAPVKSKVEVNPVSIPETKIPTTEPRVRIRMAHDHRCNIAMQFYDLKKGKCYDVPPNVKRILNKAGLLSPL